MEDSRWEGQNFSEVVALQEEEEKEEHALISQIYFCNKTVHVSDSFSVHHQEFFTVHTAVAYIQVCCVYSEKLLMMDRGTVRNM